MQIAVLGSGSWGTALAIQLARAGHLVQMWDRRPERAARHQEARENSRYLPGAAFPPSLSVTGDLPGALSGATLVLFVVPSQAVRQMAEIAQEHLPDDAVICCASKGIEQGTLMTMEEVLRDVLPAACHDRLCFLAGPSFAKEVAAGLPTAVVVAGRSEAAANVVAEALHHGPVRVYHTDDIVGAELGGALKNPIAIACGIADGCGLGLNARAGLITRGLAELSRLTVQRGGNPLTLAGLAGMGDLVLTCTGDLSRNRRVGLGLGAGKTLPEILEELGQVAEGVITARSAWQLAQREGVEMPLTEQIYRILYEDRPVGEALRDLMGRERKAERE